MNKKELTRKLMNRMTDFGYFPSFTNVKVFIREYEKMTKPEPQKPVVPQFVADYIEFKKEQNFHVYGAMRVIEGHYDKRVPDWFYEGNIETFVRAWLDGYEVKGEKRYLVKVKNVLTRQGALNRNKKSGRFIFSNPEENSLYDTKFTRKELEEAGFGEVFDSPLFEVEEVKG